MSEEKKRTNISFEVSTYHTEPGIPPLPGLSENIDFADCKYTDRPFSPSSNDLHVTQSEFETIITEVKSLAEQAKIIHDPAYGYGVCFPDRFPIIKNKFGILFIYTGTYSRKEPADSISVGKTFAVQLGPSEKAHILGTGLAGLINSGPTREDLDDYYFPNEIDKEKIQTTNLLSARLHVAGFACPLICYRADPSFPPLPNAQAIVQYGAHYWRTNPKLFHLIQKNNAILPQNRYYRSNRIHIGEFSFPLPAAELCSQVEQTTSGSSAYFAFTKSDAGDNVHYLQIHPDDFLDAFNYAQIHNTGIFLAESYSAEMETDPEKTTPPQRRKGFAPPSTYKSKVALSSSSNSSAFFSIPPSASAVRESKSLALSPEEQWCQRLRKLAAGEDPDKTIADNKGRTIASINAELAKTLIDGKRRFENFQELLNAKGKTKERNALHWACAYKNPSAEERIALLLDAGADCNLKDKDGKTSYDLGLENPAKKNPLSEEILMRLTPKTPTLDAC